MEKIQHEKIEQHLKDILNECEGGDLEQIKHNVFEIREHLSNPNKD